jgi:hypothetical protein
MSSDQGSVASSSTRPRRPRADGEWTATYFVAADPETLGEPVGFFGSQGQPSPFWHAIGREFVERWIHHSSSTSAILTPGHTVKEIRSLVTERSDRVELLAMVARRP